MVSVVSLCCTHPKVMTGNGQLTKINDFLRNPHFNRIGIMDLIYITRVGVVMKSINGVSCNLKIESVFAFRSYTMAAAKADFNVL